MTNLIRTSTPVARKVHRCRCCGAPAVQPGDKYKRDTLVYDGRIYDWVSCVECSALFATVWDWSDGGEDGIGPEQYAEWALDYADDPEHGEKARAYLLRAGFSPDSY